MTPRYEPFPRLGAHTTTEVGVHSKMAIAIVLAVAAHTVSVPANGQVLAERIERIQSSSQQPTSVFERATDQNRGKDVRVTFFNDSNRRGRLILIVDSEVVFVERNKGVSVPLSEVYRVERITHNARKFATIFAAATCAIVCVQARLSDYDHRGWLLAVALPITIAIGAGAAMGAVEDRTEYPARVIYPVTK